MKCYNHTNIDAVGICKNCNKGLCKDCLTEVENGIACTSSCVDEVYKVNALINRSKNAYKTTGGAHLRNAYMLGIMGIGFIFFGLNSSITYLIWFLSVMGLTFIIGAIFSYTSYKKYNNQN